MRHPSLVTGNLDQTILEMIAPPELHLMLGWSVLTKLSLFHNHPTGVVDKLITEFRRNVFEEGVGKQFMSEFFRKVSL